MDAVRDAVAAIKPVLQEMRGEERRRICADVAQWLRDEGYVKHTRIEMVAERDDGNEDSGELGKRIMGERNPNYKDD